MQEIIEAELTAIFGRKATVEAYFETMPVRLVSLGIRVLVVLVLMLIGSWLIRLLCRFIKKSLNKSKIENGSVTFITATIKAILYCILIAMLAGYFGVDAASIVTVLGSLGLTLGLAAQGSLSNFAGGVLILVSKPFKVGDYIIESSTGMEGVVYEIHLFYSKLKTLDNKLVIIPNGVLANTTLTDCSAMKERRVDLVIPIPYSADIDFVRTILLDAMNEEKILTHDRKVFMSAFASSSVEIGVEFYVKTSDFLEMKRYMLEKIKKTFDANGISIPFEQLDVHMV